MRLLLFLALSLFIILSCKHKQTYNEKKKELNAGKLTEDNLYTVKEVGWTVKIPDGWRILTREENSKLTVKGKEAMEKSSNIEVDVSNLVSLLSFKKDMYNSFLSTMQAFDENEYGSYDKQSFAVHQVIKETYAAKNIPAEYELAASRVGGIMFDRFIAKVYSPDKKKIIMTQEMFSCLINGYDFAMTINYNNDKDKETLLNVITTSTFSDVKNQ